MILRNLVLITLRVCCRDCLLRPSFRRTAIRQETMRMLPLNEYQTSVVERGKFGCFGASHIILRNRQSRLDDLVTLELRVTLEFAHQNKTTDKIKIKKKPI